MSSLDALKIDRHSDAASAEIAERLDQSSFLRNLGCDPKFWFRNFFAGAATQFARSPHVPIVRHRFYDPRDYFSDSPQTPPSFARAAKPDGHSAGRCSRRPRAGADGARRVRGDA